jgi:hypothetical protein
MADISQWLAIALGRWNSLTEKVIATSRSRNNLRTLLLRCDYFPNKFTPSFPWLWIPL